MRAGSRGRLALVAFWADIQYRATSMGLGRSVNEQSCGVAAKDQ